MIDLNDATSFLWRGVIPLLPFVLLLNARIWRNACPLGRLSEGARADLPASPDLRAASSDLRASTGIPRARIGVAVLLFASILPLRAAWFADSALATAAFFVGLGAAAWVLGRRAPRRAGFCTTLCPMVPVELLYGQAPLVRVGRGDCDTCSLCTPRACPQLSPRAAIAQHLGDARHRRGWTRTPFGAFAAAFPGVILAFFLADTSSLPTAALHLVLGACASWLVGTAVVVVFRPRWDRALLGLGFTAVALWAWYALPGVAEAWGWPDGGAVMRASGETLALLWLVHGLRP